MGLGGINLGLGSIDFPRPGAFFKRGKVCRGDIPGCLGDLDLDQQGLYRRPRWRRTRFPKIGQLILRPLDLIPGRLELQSGEAGKQGFISGSGFFDLFPCIIKRVLRGVLSIAGGVLFVCQSIAPGLSLGQVGLCDFPTQARLFYLQKVGLRKIPDCCIGTVGRIESCLSIGDGRLGRRNREVRVP